MISVNFKQHTIRRFYVVKDGYDILGTYETAKQARRAHEKLGRGEILAACCESGSTPVYAPNMTAAMRKIQSKL